MGLTLLSCMPDNEELLNLLSDNFASAAETVNTKLDSFNAISNYDDIGRVLAMPQYANMDIVVVNEKLPGGASDKNVVTLGPDRLKKWVEQYKSIRFIAVVARNAKSKISKLFNSNYYDLLFMEDIDNTEIIGKLLLRSRTREEAIEYYNIDPKYIKNSTSEITVPESMTAKEVLKSGISETVEFDMDTAEQITVSSMVSESEKEVISNATYISPELVIEPPKEVHFETNSELINEDADNKNQLNPKEETDTGNKKQVNEMTQSENSQDNSSELPLEQVLPAAEVPYMNWIPLNGFISRITGENTCEVQILGDNFNLTDINNATLVVGSPVNILISLGAINTPDSTE